MLLTLQDDYELCIDDYHEKGAQITMKKKKQSSLPFISIVVLLVSTLAIFKDAWVQKQQVYISVSLLSVLLLCLIFHLRSIYSESLLIIASIGLTVRQSSLLGTTLKFYEVQQIEDIVIVEAVTMSRIIFQLVLLPRHRKQSDNMLEQSFIGSTIKQKDKLHPLFQNFRPKLKDLQTVYRHIQEKLILPSQAVR